MVVWLQSRSMPSSSPLKEALRAAILAAEASSSSRAPMASSSSRAPVAVKKEPRSSPPLKKPRGSAGLVPGPSVKKEPSSSSSGARMRRAQAVGHFLPGPVLLARPRPRLAPKAEVFDIAEAAEAAEFADEAAEAAEFADEADEIAAEAAEFADEIAAEVAGADEFDDEIAAEVAEFEDEFTRAAKLADELEVCGLAAERPRLRRMVAILRVPLSSRLHRITVVY